jgi:hypothetical protein
MWREIKAHPYFSAFVGLVLLYVLHVAVWTP